MTRVRLPEELRAGARVGVPDDQARHLRTVLRLDPGARVEAVDAAGRLWTCELVSTEPVLLDVDAECEAPATAPSVDLEVWVPLLKGGRTDDLVRQLTEIGARRVVPFVAARSVARLDGAKAARRLARWRTIAEEATRQCGRLDIPEVAPLRGLPDQGPGVFLWEEGAELAREVLERLGSGGRLAVLVGPEGGLTAAEAAGLRERGWEAAWLGPRILRAETAVVAAAVLAMHALGEGGY